MKRYLLLASFVIPVMSYAQFNYIPDQSIVVHNEDGSVMPMPWAGGINAAQFNKLELNGDDQEDLVLFDRMANKVITFVNENNQYRYAPEYESLFPADITSWMLTRDFNCDGKKDLFTGDVLGMKVYANTTMPGENLSWKKYYFFIGPNKKKQPVLLTKGFSGLVNLQLQYDDLPAVVDMDGDGDLDILSMRYAAEGTVEFHKNFSKERYNTCDSLEFERITQNWGNFKECECGEFAFNNTECPPSDDGRKQHAAGKSLLALDVDGDTDMDLLLSESSCTKLYLLKNEGTTAVPQINSSDLFPISDPVNFYVFPGAFYEDIDFDGVKDIVATPNIYSKTFFNTNLSASNWFYKNTGSTQSPDFTFVKTNLLQDQMIDVGDNAIPAFADYDDDGDYDLFISENSTPNFVSAIFLYENVGTSTAPEFKLITDNYQNFASFNLYNLKINFADLNSDGKTDLVFSGTSIQGNVTRLFYLANKGGKVFNFTNQTPIQIEIDIAYNDNVNVTDVDADGKVDLLIGKSEGALAYYRNESSLNFALKNGDFLGLSAVPFLQYPACAVADFDSNGTDDLIYGDQTGILKIIPNYRTAGGNAEAVTQIFFNSVTENYEAHNFGGRLWPTSVDLYSTNNRVIVIGNILGGIQILKNQQSGMLPEIAVINIYPNPIQQDENLFVKIDRSATLQVFSSLGQSVNEPVQLLGNQVYSFNMSVFSRGLYFYRFTVNGKSYTRRVVIY